MVAGPIPSQQPGQGNLASSQHLSRRQNRVVTQLRHGGIQCGDSPDEQGIEMRMVVALQNALDEDSIAAMDGAAVDVSSRLYNHVRQDFYANTESLSRQKRADWGMYSRFMCEGKTKDIDELPWPPTCKSWVQFMIDLRPKVGSQPRFNQVLHHVCSCASSFWGRARGVQEACIDPRSMYARVHTSTDSMLQREYGFSVSQVAPITQYEAINGPYFCGQDRVREIMMGAAWCMGAALGGRRPRTLSSLRLEDVTLRAVLAQRQGHGSEEVLVPELEAVLKDEKTQDVKGFRVIKDPQQGREHYDDWYINSAAYWGYRLLCIRGVFLVEDPLRHAMPGDVLQIRPRAKAFFLFCASRAVCTADWWLDCKPVGVDTLGDFTREVLQRMGQKPRGFSAHRSGAVTRACIIAILSARGLGMDQAIVESILRLGGWQAVTGAMTVFRVYARKVIDSFVDPYQLFLGREMSDDFWAAQKHDYLAVRLLPGNRAYCFRKTIPVQVFMRIARGPAWQHVLDAVNDLAQGVLELGMSSARVWPVARYTSLNRCFNMTLAMLPDEDVVVQFKAAWLAATRGVSERVQAELQQCQAAYIRAHASASSLPRSFWKESQYLADLQGPYYGQGSAAVQKGMTFSFGAFMATKEYCWTVNG